MCITSNVDTGGKWKKIFNHKSLNFKFLKFAAGIVDTGGKFAAGINNTSETGGTICRLCR
jgi:hypothetical protein